MDASVAAIVRQVDQKLPFIGDACQALFPAYGFSVVS
jgi:hypothetical protein